MARWLIYILVSILCPFSAQAALPKPQWACLEVLKNNALPAKINSILASSFMNTAEWIVSHQPQIIPSKEKLEQAKLVAHRGVHEFPENHPDFALENTLDAFRNAMKYKLWGIEFDVRLTADRVPVIIHDADLGRVFGRPDVVVSQLNFAELRRIEPRVPTLVEVLALTSGEIHIMIEIKEDYRLHPETYAVIEHYLRHLTPIKDYHLISLNPNHLERFTHTDRQAFMDVIWQNPSTIIKQNDVLQHGAVSGHYLFISESQREKLQAAGKKVGVGFPTNLNVALRAINQNADWIFTNHGAKLQTELSALRARYP